MPEKLNNLSSLTFIDDAKVADLACDLSAVASFSA